MHAAVKLDGKNDYAPTILCITITFIWKLLIYAWIHLRSLLYFHIIYKRHIICAAYYVHFAGIIFLFSQINEVRKLIAPLSDRLPNFCTDASISRYLRARNWNTEKASKMLKENLKWRLEYKPEAIRWVGMSPYFLIWLMSC